MRTMFSYVWLLLLVLCCWLCVARHIDDRTRVSDDSPASHKHKSCAHKHKSSAHEHKPCSHKHSSSSEKDSSSEEKKSSCTDRKKSPGETDIDCGGNKCAKCVNRKICRVDCDCISGFCQRNRCARSTSTTTEIVTTAVPIIRSTSTEAPEIESTSTEAPEIESTLTEVPEVESTSTEAPEIESTPSEAPEIQSTSTEAPEVESTMTEAPEIKSTPTEAPEIESTPTEAPEIQSTSTEAPEVESTMTEAPEIESTPTEAPEIESTPTEAPEIQSTATEAPESESTSTETPEIESTSTETPEIESTSTEAPELESTATEAPEVESTSTEAPEVESTPTEAPAIESTPVEALNIEVTTSPAPEITSTTTPTCDGGCQNGGTCISHNQCACTTDFSGSTCEVQSVGLCLNDETFDTEPLLLITFGNGTAQYSSATPASFNFTTTYRQVFEPETNDGMFSFINSVHNDFNHAWHTDAKDHSKGNNGYMYLVNADYNAGKFYTGTVNNLCIGLRYEFSVYLANVGKSNYNIKPNVLFEVRTVVGNTLLAQMKSGDVDAHDTLTWKKYGFSFIPTSSSVNLLMISNAPGGGGNDLVIDDIALHVCAHEGTGFCPSNQ